VRNGDLAPPRRHLAAEQCHPPRTRSEPTKQDRPKVESQNIRDDAMTTVPTAQNLTTDAVIVGAGLAGLSAEYALRGTGLRVQLLEADEQIGGRTRGEYWPAAGRHIDLGASWLTDEFRHARKFASTFGLA